MNNKYIISATYLLFLVIMIVFNTDASTANAASNDGNPNKSALIYAKMPVIKYNYLNSKYKLVIMNFSTLEYAPNLQTSVDWFYYNTNDLYKLNNNLEIYIYLTINSIDTKREDNAPTFYYEDVYNWFADEKDNTLHYGGEMLLKRNGVPIPFDSNSPWPYIYLLDVRREDVKTYISNVAYGVVKKINQKYIEKGLNIKINLFYDMLEDFSRAPDVISHSDWKTHSSTILSMIHQQINQLASGTMVLSNAGKTYSNDCVYLPLLNGFLMENFLGTDSYYQNLSARYHFGATLDEGITAATQAILSCRSPRKLIFNTDTTLLKSEEARYLSFALSLIYDSAYHAHDGGAEDHGTPDWIPIYDLNFGTPLNSPYNTANGNIRRDFANGSVFVAKAAETINFNFPHVDINSGKIEKTFNLAENQGEKNGYLFLKKSCIEPTINLLMNQ